MAKTAFPSLLRLPAKSMLALSLLAAFAPGFAATTVTTVPSGTVVTITEPYYFLGNSGADNDTLNVQNAGTQWNNSGDLTVGAFGTGALNIENGGVVSNTSGYVGNNAGGTGTVKVTGADTQWNNSYDLTVGAFGTGTLNIENGGVVSNTFGYVGNNAGGTGTVKVTGAGSQWNNSGDLTVGNNGTGALNIANGGVVSSNFGYVGRESSGTVNVTGADSQWNNSGLLFVGTIGTGALNIENGGVVSSTDGYVGVYASSNGTVKVTGAGSQWNNSGDLRIGFDILSTGALNIENGGVVSSARGYVGNGYYSQGTVNVTGAGSQWNNSGDLTVGNNGTGALNIANGGVVSNTAGYVGYAGYSNGTVKVTGAGSQWNNSGDLVVGNIGTGTLNIENGGVVSNTFGYVGNNAGGTGTVKITGAGSQWNNSSTLTVGNDSLSTGTLNILNSGKVTAQALTIGAKGNVTLDGGTLQIANGSIATGGVFNWTQGTLGYTGDASIGAGLLKKTTILTDGQTLAVQNTLTVGDGRTLLLDGGNIVSNGTVYLSNTGTLIGHGTVLGTVVGGTANTITASGGTLTAGNAGMNGGYAFGGTLNVGSQQVVLLSADKAQLGVATNLGPGGNLSTVNGANLAKGNGLTFNGNSTIQGNFTNNGSVSGSAGTLSFLNDVNGAGSFAGNIAFKAAFNPGNSPASVRFNGGNASFDSASVLNMEIFGNTPGAQYDQLVSINTLTFNGKLNLVFGNGYVPLAGSSFSLFGFNTFSGSFGTAADGYSKITVAGYDRTKLDFSHLATDGTLSVTAVPEPETYAMMLAGLALMGTVARRRKAVATV